MKLKIVKFGLTIFLIFTLFSCSSQKTEWQGTIEEVEGVTVVKNPKMPIFGEVRLELEQSLSIGNESDDNYFFYKVRKIGIDSEDNIYVLDSGNRRIQKFDKDGAFLMTIGKKGQGPGEFGNPYDIFITKKKLLYVLDNRKVILFNELGSYQKTIHLEINASELLVTAQGSFIARINPAQERKKSLVHLNSDGKLIQQFAECPDVEPSVRKGQNRGSYVTFVAFHDYTPQPRFAILDEERILYGYPLEYEINVISTSGESLFKIYKEDKKELITQKEKDKIITEIEASISQSGQTWPKGVLEEACRFPAHRPFFRNILTDEKKRLHVIRVTSVLNNNEKIKLDIFDNKGNYLYKTKIPFIPEIIFNGHMYELLTIEETGEIRIIKHKIKNWNQLKTEIN